jgi:hypothetical protein
MNKKNNVNNDKKKSLNIQCRQFFQLHIFDQMLVEFRDAEPLEVKDHLDFF